MTTKVGPRVLPPELDRAYRLDDGPGEKVVLLASRCANRLSFPPRAYCGESLDAPQQVEVRAVGRVYCYTIVRVRPPYGLPTPYAVGYVDIDNADLRIFGLFDEEIAADLALGMPVELRARMMGVDNSGAACLRPVFSRREELA